MPIYKKVNKDFFKTWTPEMAYVLGFFAADGGMIKNKRGGYFVEFTNTDRILLQIVKNVMSSNHKISHYNNHPEKWKTRYRIQIGSKEMFGDLIKLGFTPNKSNTLKFPNIPNVCVKDFIRGYFDGDGSVYFKKHFAKDRGKKRWVFQTRFTSGSRKFLESLHLHLKQNGVRGGFITNKIRGYDLVLSHKDGIALSHLMYDKTSASMYLKRKYLVFQKVNKILYKNAGVA